MMPDLVPLAPLSPGQLSVMRTRAALSTIPLLGIAAAVELAEVPRVPTGVPLVVVLLLAAWMALVAPARRFRHWGWAFTGSELHVRRGWFVRVHTVVPVPRVQHIDISQGPLERRWRVAKLVLHTAGTEHSRVDLPGLPADEAEAIRDTIRTSIGKSATW